MKVKCIQEGASSVHMWSTWEKFSIWSIKVMLCPCTNSADYVGSSKNMKSRWSKHKWDIRNSNWTACGLTKHFGQHHQGNLEAAISGLKVVLLDSCNEESNLKKIEYTWMCLCNLGTLFVGLNSHNEVLTNRRRKYGLA